ncbi:MAG: hypothetical protein U9O87_01490 [Verrucomicrobiota bacterium]|nr:hypothetical protein [Verrucomicrobiota bacterium]
MYEYELTNKKVIPVIDLRQYKGIKKALKETFETYLKSTKINKESFTFCVRGGTVPKGKLIGMGKAITRNCPELKKLLLCYPYTEKKTGRRLKSTQLFIRKER